MNELTSQPVLSGLDILPVLQDLHFPFCAYSSAKQKSDAGRQTSDVWQSAVPVPKEDHKVSNTGWADEERSIR